MSDEKMVKMLANKVRTCDKPKPQNFMRLTWADPFDLARSTSVRNLHEREASFEEPIKVPVNSIVEDTKEENVENRLWTKNRVTTQTHSYKNAPAEAWQDFE